MIQQAHKDIQLATLIKTPLQYLVKNLYDKIYRAEILNAMTLAEQTKLLSINREALENHIISKVYAQEEIMKALTYDEKYAGFNSSIASLQGSNLNIMKNQKLLDFIAFNKVNTCADLTQNEKTIIEAKQTPRPFIISYRDNTTLPIKRLAIYDLSFYHPQNLSQFAAKRQACAEKKILSKIVNLYNAEKSLNPAYQNTDLGGTLYLYSKMEPCSYCFNALQEFMQLTKTKIVIIYEELLFELTRDKLNIRPKKIVNLTAPTSYDSLHKYDQQLAIDLKKQIIKDKGFDISKRWEPFRAY